MIIASQHGYFLRISRNETEWVVSAEDATVFATPEAFAQCCAFGRIRHLGLSFYRWVGSP